jgi:hypothetical protein
VHCLHSSFSTALLLQGQEVLRREAATLLARSLAAEKLAADRLVALTEKEQAADHLQQSLCDANTALAEALQVKFLPVLQYLALCCCVHETYAPSTCYFLETMSLAHIVDICRTNGGHLATVLDCGAHHHCVR